MDRCVVKVNLAANGIVGKDNRDEKDGFLTEINGTPEEVRKYYAIGKVFNMGIWYDSKWHLHEDNLMHVTDVFVLEDCEKNGIDKETVLWLNPRMLWDCDHFFAEPLEKPKNVVGPMFGGNFCYTSDSRLYRFGGDYHLPIPIHDRFETEREYSSYD